MNYVQPTPGETMRLAEVVQQEGLISDGDWVESKDQDPEGDVRLIQLADVGVGAYLNKSARFLTSSKAKELRCTFLRPGDLLVARMPDPIGRACIFPGDPRPAVTVVDVCIVRPDPRVCDPRWLCWMINAPDFADSVLKQARGATRQRISRTELERLSIPRISLGEQRRIAAILDEAEALRAKRRAALAHLDEMARAIFVELFGTPSAPKSQFTTRPFSSVCQTRLGKMLDQKRQTGEFKRRYLRNANVRWFGFDLSDLLEMDFSPADQETYRLLPGDILICEGGEPGRAAIWRGQLDECFYQKALHRARPDPTLAVPEYIVWVLWFLANGNGLKDHVTVATIAHLTKEKLDTLRIPVPPLPLQTDFAKRLASLDEARTAAIASYAALNSLFASLQHRAFRGEL